MPRPKSFDRYEVLEQAMNLFWDSGYRATSIQDLENHLGINRVSLYREFGNKHDLFLAALDHYSEKVIDSGLAVLISPPDGLASIQRFFEMTLEATERGNWRSCLMSNSASELARHDRDTARRTEQSVARLEGAFLGALTRARGLGELASDADLPSVAQYLTTLQLGLVLVGDATADRTRRRNTVDVVLRHLKSL